MELRDYLRILWSRKGLITLSSIACVGAALALSARITPTYAASAKVFIGPRSIAPDDAAGALQELTFSGQFVSSYAEILKSRPLAELVVKETKASISAEELAKHITTKIIPDTRLIEVTVTATSPHDARVFANGLVNSFVSNQENRFGGGGIITAGVLEEALDPDEPVAPKPLQNSLVGAVLGLLLGMGIAFVLEQLDSTLRTKEDVERIFAPLHTIATIPAAQIRKGSIFLETSPNSPESEAMRILRTNVHFLSAGEPLQRILVSSTLSGEGKTTVALNLAAGIAATNLQVLLIEADLRRPALAGYFPDAGGPGLSEVLSGQASLAQATHQTVIPNLAVVLSGTPPPNPSELLGSQTMADLLDFASTTADIIVIDTPPALPVTDAIVLAPQADGVILVVRAGETSAHKALDVARGFERSGVRVLGVALNAVEVNGENNYYYHYPSLTGKNDRRSNRKRARLDDQIVRNAPSHRASRATAVSPIGGTPTGEVKVRIQEPVTSGNFKSRLDAVVQERQAPPNGKITH